MLPLFVFGAIVFALAYHVREVAEVRGRDATGWMIGTGAAGFVGLIVGALLAPRAPETTLEMVLKFVSPGLVGLGLVACVVAAAYLLPLEVGSLDANVWTMRRLDGDEGSCEVSLASGELKLAGAVEARIPVTNLTRFEQDGEALSLGWVDQEGKPGRVLLMPVGLPSRETRVHFCRTVSERIGGARSGANRR